MTGVQTCALPIYETGSRTPKADLTAALAQVLDVSPHALSVPDIDSYVGLMHTLFTLEDNYGLKITEQDGELALQVDFRKNKDAARLHEMLWACLLYTSRIMWFQNINYISEHLKPSYHYHKALVFQNLQGMYFHIFPWLICVLPG